MARRARPKPKKRGRKTAKRASFTLATLMVVAVAGLAGWNWLERHPQHNPWAPLDLRVPIGLATSLKLVALRDDIPACRAVLDRSEIAYSALPATGEGPCARSDRTKLSAFPLSPSIPVTTCPVAAALELWRTQSVEPAAQDIFDREVVRFEHMGVYNCRRMRGGSSSAWSQHSTGNAIDISAIVLSDGTRISLIDDWEGDAEKARFLRTIRDDACDVFAVVLSPDYNAAHVDHFHFDQGGTFVGNCR
ncbi:extensin family protein [uncultured Erythrobacter sp.]|uniref:extensin-like domain-containing protein n=1 Tax=uncultured Erythrobacter sp. TaxID=263913 RepID=UPI002603B117|nr:extensin family protein [uncultured Erythrobacter sp.]